MPFAPRCFTLHALHCAYSHQLYSSSLNLPTLQRRQAASRPLKRIMPKTLPAAYESAHEGVDVGVEPEVGARFGQAHVPKEHGVAAAVGEGGHGS